MEDKNKNYKELTEDTTKYGEFISSCFNWTTIENQKKKAEELCKITKKN